MVFVWAVSLEFTWKTNSSNGVQKERNGMEWNGMEWNRIE